MVDYQKTKITEKKIIEEENRTPNTEGKELLILLART